MGSPGVFIHSGTLGGRLLALSLAPAALVPASPPPRTAPPNNALLSRRNRRRDVAVISLLRSAGSVIVHPPRGAWNSVTRPKSYSRDERHPCCILPGKARLALG